MCYVKGTYAYACFERMKVVCFRKDGGGKRSPLQVIEINELANMFVQLYLI